MTKFEQYQICKERGHYPSKLGLNLSGNTVNICQFCGTHYYEEVTTKLIEKNIPTEDK